MNIFNIEYGDNFSLEGMVQYLTDIEGHKNKHTSDPIAFYTGFGVDPYNAALDMTKLKNYYGETLHKQYWHFEVSLEKQTYNPTTLTIFYDIGKRVYEWSNCQMVMAIHINTTFKTGCLHCHYLLNSVAVDGTRFTLKNYGARDSLEKIINNVLVQNGLSPVNIPHNKNCKVFRPYNPLIIRNEISPQCKTEHKDN